MKFLSDILDLAKLALGGASNTATLAVTGSACVSSSTTPSTPAVGQLTVENGNQKVQVGGYDAGNAAGLYLTYLPDFNTLGGALQFARGTNGLFGHSLYAYETAEGLNNLAITARSETVFINNIVERGRIKSDGSLTWSFPIIAPLLTAPALSITPDTSTAPYPVDIRRSSLSSQMHLSGLNDDAGGWIGSRGVTDINLSAGAYYDGTAFVAKNAAPALLILNGLNGLSVTADTGRTVGSTYTPTNILTLSTAGTLTINSVNTKSLSLGYRAVTAATTIVAATDYLIRASATTAPFTVTLPTAVGVAGRTFEIKRINTGANVVTVGTTASQTIDGATTFPLSTQYATLTVMSDGANWMAI